MPSPSKREQILDAIIARLEAITAGATFTTSAGGAVYLGEVPALGEDDPREAIVVVVEDDEVGQFHANKGFLTLPITIQAIVAVGNVKLRVCYRDAERVLADVKRAIELPDRTLGGLVAWHGLERGTTQVLKREPGSEFVGVSIQYRAPMHETWGAP